MPDDNGICPKRGLQPLWLKGYCCGLPQNEEQKALMKPCPHLIVEGSKTTCAIYDKRPQGCKDFPSRPQDLVDGVGFRNENCGYDFEEK